MSKLMSNLEPFLFELYLWFIVCGWAGIIKGHTCILRDDDDAKEGPIEPQIPKPSNVGPLSRQPLSILLQMLPLSYFHEQKNTNTLEMEMEGSFY